MAFTSLSVSGASAGTFTRSATVPAFSADAGILQVQYRGGQRQRAQGRDHRRAQQRTQQRRGFWRQGGRAYYNGHRGYTQRRAGYRLHGGFWFPPAAFIMGAIIGGALASPPAATVPGRLSQAHVNWCRSRYVSYRLSDNTFQPFSGPRRACVSPYS
jgi:hypothetical protein